MGAMSAQTSPTPDGTATAASRQDGLRSDLASTRAFKANPMRRYLLTSALGLLLPAVAIAWLLGNFVTVRITGHIAQAGSSEVAANIGAVLRQSGLGMASAGDGIVVREGTVDSLAAWEYFTTIVERNPNAVAVRIYDPSGIITFADNRGLIGMEPSRDDALTLALQGHRATRVATPQLTGPGRTYAVLVPLVSANGQSAGVVEVVHDIGSLREDMVLARWLITLGVLGISLAFIGAMLILTTRLARSSFIDPITKLPNSSYLESAARVVLERNAKLGRGAAVVLLDLDRFKMVNDTLGRTQGDRLLHDVARRLQGLVRSGDYVARLGGDEFALLFSGADEAATHAAVDRVVDAVSRPFTAGGHDLRLDASVGVSLFPRDGVDLHTLLQRAEIAMYRAKELRLPISFYRHGKQGTRRHSLYLETDLRDALDKDQLELVYQPICRLDTGETIALEALMRWNHPIRGRLSPGLFIPIAEEIGLIRQIDAHALRIATQQLARWAKTGSSVRVTVNVSAQTVSDLQLPDTLMELLREAGAPPHQLVLEVTERAALEDIESSAGILQRIRDTGVHIALDDFGRGYSSLGTLDRLPISFLKIDAGFTRGIGSMAKDEHLIKAITLFTTGIGMPFVAEGIENETQRAWLMKEGVKLGQGYLLARPGSADEIFLARSSATTETLLRHGHADRHPMNSRKPN